MIESTHASRRTDRQKTLIKRPIRRPIRRAIKRARAIALQFGLLLPLVVHAGCSLFPASEAQRGQGDRLEGSERPVAVKTALAETGSIASVLTYTGTTRPVQQVALRAQVSGEVTGLLADVGDRVERGMLLAQLDGDLQTTSVNQARAELSARRAETAQAAVSISDAQTDVAQAQATLDQAKIDAQRLRQLASQGAIAQQVAEAAELALTNAQQTLRSAQAQVEAQRQAATSAADRIDAQQAVVAQSQKQLSYADLRSPLTGVVLSRRVDVGSFVESGTTILELGDISTLEVTVEVSELDIAQFSVGQSARVTLDAFPSEGSIPGQITQISPLANTVSRLVPVRVAIANSTHSSTGRQIGSGLLARVQFTSGQRPQVVVPADALALGEAGKGGTVFVVEGTDEQAQAIARPVRTGERGPDRIEILSGLDLGEAFIVQSDRPLTSGQAIRLSILSESGTKSQTRSTEGRR